MRKVAWIWVLVAFVVGLLAPAAGAVWLWRTDRSTRAALVSRNAELNTENKALTTRLNSAEASVSALNTRVDSLQAQSSGTPATSIVGTAAGAPSGPPNIYERSVSPTEVAAGGKLTLTIRLTGHASLAKMRIVGGSFDKIYDLAREKYDSRGEVWQNVVKAPPAGTYHFYAIAYDAANAKYTMKATAGYTFTSK